MAFIGGKACIGVGELGAGGRGKFAGGGPAAGVCGAEAPGDGVGGVVTHILQK